MWALSSHSILQSSFYVVKKWVAFNLKFADYLRQQTESYQKYRLTVESNLVKVP